MTRLRIKTADGKLERITVSDDSTLRELKEVIAKKLLCDTSTTQIRLSLNKKVLIRRGLEPCAVKTFVSLPVSTRFRVTAFFCVGGA